MRSVVYNGRMSVRPSVDPSILACRGPRSICLSRRSTAATAPVGGFAAGVGRHANENSRSLVLYCASEMIWNYLLSYIGQDIHTPLSTAAARRLKQLLSLGCITCTAGMRPTATGGVVWSASRSVGHDRQPSTTAELTEMPLRM